MTKRKPRTISRQVLNVFCQSFLDFMLKLFRIGFAILALVIAAGILFPQARTWGVHFLAYYSTGTQAVFALIAAALVSFSLFPSLAVSIASKLGARRSRPWLIDTLVALLCGAGFYVFSSAVPLLGDGQLWIDKLSGSGQEFWLQRGPLTPIAVIQAHHVLNLLFHWDVPAVFRFISVVSGIAVTLAWLRYARCLGQGLMTALLWGFAWGGVALFFGYVELYSIMVAVCSIALAILLISLRRNRFSFWVPFLAVLAAGFHYTAVTLWPAVGFYVYWGIARKPLKPKVVLMVSAILFTLAGIAYFFLGWYRGTETLMPLWPSAISAGGYGFAPRHFIDLANGLFLSAGPLMVLALAILSTRCGQPFWNTEKLLLTLALVVPFAAYFMHNSGLGMARDWDIGATLLLTVPFASLSLWSDRITSLKERTSGMLLVAAWVAIVTIPWIGIQASEARAMARFSDLLRLDPERSANGWDYLGAFYRQRGQTDEWARCYEEALKHSANPRYHYNLAIYNIYLRQWEKSLAHVNAARDAVYADSAITGWEESVIDPRSMVELGFEYEKLARFDDATQVFWLASQLDPNSPLPPTAMAEMIVRRHDLARADGMFRMLLAAFPQHLPEVKRYYMSLTQEKTADKQIEGFSGLAILAKIEGDPSGARESLKRALELAPGESQITAYLAALQ